MIGRIWRGATRAEDADEYLAYLERTGLAAYRATPGNRGALVLRRVREGRAELAIVTLWDSEDAVRAFAGDDATRAVFSDVDDRYLVARDERATHHALAWGAVDDDLGALLGALAGGAR